MTDWKKIAEARSLSIPETELDRIIPVMQNLEQDFRKVNDKISANTDSAALFRCEPEGE
jgi:hypothetical protein